MEGQHLRVLAPIKGGPAEQAGVLPGDEVRWVLKGRERLISCREVYKSREYVEHEAASMYCGLFECRRVYETTSEQASVPPGDEVVEIKKSALSESHRVHESASEQSDVLPGDEVR
jgi:hypothetical protein